jgi:solute carrier family 13 (sodium-dependent dicarboxylate transporter), member 2/3/5
MTAIPSFSATTLPRGVLAVVGTFCATFAIWALPQGLGPEARMALVITVLAIAGWAHPRLPDTLVALAAGLALVLTGVVPDERLFAMLGSELIWLLLAAFVIAAVIRDSGLALRIAAPVFALRLPFAGLIAALTLFIAATALVLPSTSGRAALLLPVCLALTSVLTEPKLKLALALLFPTVILLSAGGSIVGAGAHLLAVEAIAASGGPRLGYLDWLMIGGPLALLASAAGAVLVLVLFVPRGMWGLRVAPPAPAGPMTVEHRRIGAVALGLVTLWVTEDLHGIGMAVVALLGAVILLTPPFGRRKPKEVFRTVDLDLILFMAMAALVAEALIATGADRWLADGVLSALPGGPAAPGWLVVGGLAVVAVLSHLVITSRSARAAVLIPAVALPAAALGQDPALIVLVMVMGTGFCQTMMASAKPVAIFGQAEGAGFAPGDLFRLAVPLAPVMAALVTFFALEVWPRQLARLQAPMQVVSTELPTPQQRAAIAAMPEEMVPDVVALAEAPTMALSLHDQVRTSVTPASQALTRGFVPPTAAKAKKKKVVTRKPTRFEQDLRAAEAQIARDLRKVERQFLSLFR